MRRSVIKSQVFIQVTPRPWKERSNHTADHSITNIPTKITTLPLIWLQPVAAFMLNYWKAKHLQMHHENQLSKNQHIGFLCVAYNYCSKQIKAQIFCLQFLKTPKKKDVKHSLLYPQTTSLVARCTWSWLSCYGQWLQIEMTTHFLAILKCQRTQIFTNY